MATESSFLYYQNQNHISLCRLCRVASRFLKRTRRPHRQRTKRTTCIRLTITCPMRCHLWHKNAKISNEWTTRVDPIIHLIAVATRAVDPGKQKRFNSIMHNNKIPQIESNTPKLTLSQIDCECTSVRRRMLTGPRIRKAQPTNIINECSTLFLTADQF